MRRENWNELMERRKRRAKFPIKREKESGSLMACIREDSTLIRLAHIKPISSTPKYLSKSATIKNQRTDSSIIS